MIRFSKKAMHGCIAGMPSQKTLTRCLVPEDAPGTIAAFYETFGHSMTPFEKSPVSFYKMKAINVPDSPYKKSILCRFSRGF